MLSWRLKTLWGRSVNHAWCFPFRALTMHVFRTVPGTWEWLGRNTLPIILMHMIFATVRIDLFTLDVRSLWFHIPALHIASPAGPFSAMPVLEWGHLEGLVHPRR